MYVPTAEVIAAAFDLGEPAGELVLVRRGDTDTWRLDARSGSYFVKAYWPDTVAAGGDITWAGDDLNLSVIRNQLQGIFERILVLLDRTPPPRWMADRDEISQQLTESLDCLS